MKFTINILSAAVFAACLGHLGAFYHEWEFWGMFALMVIYSASSPWSEIGE